MVETGPGCNVAESRKHPCSNFSCKYFSGRRQTCKISFANINAISMDAGLILRGMVRLPWNHAEDRASISITTDGRRVAGVCLNCRWLLELGVRQGQVPVVRLLARASLRPD